MKLINMTDFVLEQEESSTFDKAQIDFYDEELGKLQRIRNYANFLKQPLALWMFVPVSESGEVLKEPNENTLDDSFFQMQVTFNQEKEYQKAKERCLFEGWKLKDPKKNLGFKIVWDDDFEINLDTLSCGQYVEGGYLDGRLLGNTIGQLADTFKGIKLTETALKTL